VFVEQDELVSRKAPDAEARRRRCLGHAHTILIETVPQTSPLEIDLPLELLGPRVRLRPYREGDAAALRDAIRESHAALSEWLIWAKDYDFQRDPVTFVRRAQANWLLRQDLFVGVFDRQSRRYLGGSGLTRMNWNIRTFEIGYWIRDSAAGNGYATEATQVLTRFAFSELQANRVEIRMDARNQRSRAIPERLGFTFEGCLRNAHPDVHGAPANVLVFSLVPDEFRAMSWYPASEHRA
jgi:ribosomal-protein-serine acetyltransferase